MSTRLYLAGRDTLRAARRALRAARYDEALDLLDGCEDWADDVVEGAVLLKAETLGRREPGEALAYLTAVDDLIVSRPARFRLELEAGRLHAAARDYSSAQSRYEDARALADSVPDGAQTMAYHDLRMRWLRRECDPRAPEAALAVTHPDPSIASAAYAYRAWLHAGAHEYEAHLTDLVRAVSFAAHEGDEPVDVATLASSIHALAQVAFETADAEGMTAARVAASGIEWTPDVRVQHFATVRAFGWDAFMRGRPAHAQWAFKEARVLAPSGAWRIMNHLDRAYVARTSGNDCWAQEELSQADALAFEVGWESTYGEDRQVLVALAVHYAAVDVARAQRYAALYSRIGTQSVNPALAMHHDERALALARYAQGRIEQMLGRRDAALRALRDAVRIFEAASFHYRAVLAATALAELTGEERWRAAAREHAARYPGSPLRPGVERALGRERAMPNVLSPVQRQIAVALWSGADYAALSRRFSRSVYRIERQAEAVFAAFGVTSREGLYAEAVRRGLV